jgi:hypothetical protein
MMVRDDGQSWARMECRTFVLAIASSFINWAESIRYYGQHND